MSLSPLVPILSATLALAAAAMLVAAGLGTPLLGLGAAAITAIALAWASLAVNRQVLSGMAGAEVAGEPAVRSRRNARLMAIAYAWGAVVMLGIDWIGALGWRHYSQYGLGFAAAAVMVFAYAHALGREASRLATAPWLGRARALAMIQGVAALAGIAWLIASGKLWSMRGDWAANLVFVSGGLAIALLSALAAWPLWRGGAPVHTQPPSQQ